MRSKEAVQIGELLFERYLIKKLVFYFDSES
jgi:hypothetical protein